MMGLIDATDTARWAMAHDWARYAYAVRNLANGGWSVRVELTNKADAECETMGGHVAPDECDRFTGLNNGPKATFHTANKLRTWAGY